MKVPKRIIGKPNTEGHVGALTMSGALMELLSEINCKSNWKRRDISSTPWRSLIGLGVFDPTLNADTLLFPDPLLLERSQHAEMRAAKVTFDQYFERVMKLLHGIQEDKDRVWKAAFKHLSFPEIKGTCLGYGSSISGSGTGPKMTTKLINSGREVIRMGIDDPDLFMAIGLFEEDFGPDLIGICLRTSALLRSQNSTKE